MMKLATFASDITPPLGHPLCAGWYPPASEIAEPLAALGVVLVPEGEKSVQCFPVTILLVLVQCVGVV